MANKNRIAYAICSAHGIDTTGMSPKEAWEKAKEVADKNELADLTQDSSKETEKEEKVDYVKLRTGNKLSSQALHRTAHDSDLVLQGLVIKLLRHNCFALRALGYHAAHGARFNAQGLTSHK